jgi:hypothetical protein
MPEILGWDTWAEKYRPIKNTIKPTNELMFETYGEEVEFVQAQDPRYVWTSVQGDMSDLIVAGYAYVNRLSYYITEVPWEDENQYVLISVEKECECYDYDTDEGSEDCKVCEGYGLVTEYVG